MFCVKQNLIGIDLTHLLYSEMTEAIGMKFNENIRSESLFTEWHHFACLTGECGHVGYQMKQLD